MGRQLPPSVTFWQAVTDPTNVESVKRIQREQRRLDFLELQAVARDLSFFIDQVIPSDEDMPREPGTVVVSIEKLDQIRRTTRKLITQSERRALRIVKDAA